MSGSLRATVARVAEAADGVEAAAAQMAQVGAAVARGHADQVAGPRAARAVGRRRSTARSAASRTRADALAHVEEAGSSVLELGAAGEQLNQTASR